ncbi:MAG: ribulose-phosphate 3-epimerase [Bacilli bacterium]|nr:ribulose-phosphate 3-epimerase [Bacilli bacterium]
MKVSVSFLTSDNAPRDLKLLNETDCDYIHVDVMDGKFVKNKTMPFSEMKNIYKYTDKRLDVHLMCADPEKYIHKYASLNTEYITIHVEINEDINKLIKLIKSYSIKVGLSIKPNTNIRDIIPYLPYIDLILVMSVEPGEGGQTFITSSEEKVKEIRKLFEEYNLNDIVINIDGGVNDDTIKYCRDCDMVTAGSYILEGDNYQKNIDSLR